MESSETDDEFDRDNLSHAANTSPAFSFMVDSSNDFSSSEESDPLSRDVKSNVHSPAGNEDTGTIHPEANGEDFMEGSSTSYLEAKEEQSPPATLPLLPLLYDPVITTKFDTVDSRNLNSCLEGQGPYLLSADFLGGSQQPPDPNERSHQEAPGAPERLNNKDGLQEKEQKSQPPLIPSHRMCEPFPLQSVWRRRVQSHLCADSGTNSAAEAHPYGEEELEEEGVTLPLLLGSIPVEQQSDPVYSDINIYNYLEGSLVNRYNTHRTRAVELLRRARDHISEPSVDRVFLTKCHLLFAQFAQQKPHLIDWNSLHNWLYSGGCLSSLDAVRCVVRPYGDSVVVSRLPSISDVSALPVTSSQQFQLPNLPRDGSVMQIDSSVVDSQKKAFIAVRYLNTCQLYSLQCDINNKDENDESLSLSRALSAQLCDKTRVARSGIFASVMMCAVLSDDQRWRCAQSDGSVFVRDVETRALLSTVQVPRFSGTQSKCWYGIHRTDSVHVTAVASPNSFYMLDDRSPSCVRVFDLTRCQHLCGADDRIHALTRACAAQGPTSYSMIATDRHVIALDLRYPSVPVLRARLVIPQAPCYLTSAPWRPNSELVVIGSSADAHIQCMAFDWLGGGVLTSDGSMQYDEATSTPCQVGVSRVLECGLGVVCGEQQKVYGDGVTLTRSRLTQVGVACRLQNTGSRDVIQVLSANWYGDVFGHTLRQRGGDEEDCNQAHEDDRISRDVKDECDDLDPAIERIGDEWNSAIARQQEAAALNRPLICRAQAGLDLQLNSLLTPPTTEEIEKMVQVPVTAIRSRLNSGGHSTADSDTVTSMLSEWDTDSDCSTENHSELSVEDELRYRSMRIASSRRRRRKRPLFSRRHCTGLSTDAKVEEEEDENEKDAGDKWPSPRRVRTEEWLKNECGESQRQEVTSTPKRRRSVVTGGITPVQPGAGLQDTSQAETSILQPTGFSQFDLSLFDD